MQNFQSPQVSKRLPGSNFWVPCHPRNLGHNQQVHNRSLHVHSATYPLMSAFPPQPQPTAPTPCLRLSPPPSQQVYIQRHIFSPPLPRSTTCALPGSNISHRFAMAARPRAPLPPANPSASKRAPNVSYPSPRYGISPPRSTVSSIAHFSFHRN